MPARNSFFHLRCKVLPTSFDPLESPPHAGANVIEATVIESWRYKKENFLSAIRMAKCSPCRISPLDEAVVARHHI